MTVWYDGLSTRQREAASHVGTHARLLAGPGTGKTRTLTRRIAKLIVEDSVPPQAILAVAFTRVNAYELRESVARHLANHGARVLPRVSTLHSWALRQLLCNSALLTTLPQPLRIADDFEEKHIIRGDLGQMVGLTARQMRGKLAELSSDWQTLSVEDRPYEPADPRFMAAWQEHRDAFGYTLRSELVWQLKHALDENPAGFALEGPIAHLLVDEYQDLNRCDLAVIRALAARGAEVFCVGDDDQSIYGFRRAHPAGIRRFLREYRPSTALELDVCWRCDRRIIAVGSYVAAQDRDPERLRKPLTACAGAGEGQARLLSFPNQYAEARAVALICRYLRNIEGYGPMDVLILLRSDHQGRYSAVLTDALAKAGLDASVRGEAGGPMDEAPGRHLLSLMRLALDDNDDLAWRTLLNHVGRPNRVGSATTSGLYAYATSQGLRFHDALARIDANPSLLRRGVYVKQEMAGIRTLTRELAQVPDAPDAEALLDSTARATARKDLLGRLADLARRIITEEEPRDAALAELGRAAARADVATLPELVAALTRPEDAPEQELEPTKVNILTMHRAKGLSAKAVILVGAEEQLMPGSAVAQEELADQRRLLYVSLTRAKHHLYVTFCNKRTGRQSHSGSDPGNPRRNLTPFLRGAMPVERGARFAAELQARLRAQG